MRVLRVYTFRVGADGVAVVSARDDNEARAVALAAIPDAELTLLGSKLLLGGNLLYANCANSINLVL